MLRVALHLGKYQLSLRQLDEEMARFKMSWSFGVLTPSGRVFRMDDGEMMIPSAQASHAVALYLGPDVLIMCRRV